MILDVIVEDKKKKLKEHKNRISEEKMKKPVRKPKEDELRSID